MSSKFNCIVIVIVILDHHRNTVILPLFSVILQINKGVMVFSTTLDTISVISWLTYKYNYSHRNTAKGA
jgi:hypothetical protein